MKYDYLIPVHGSISFIFDLIDFFKNYDRRILNWNVLISAITIQSIEISLLYLIFKNLM